MRWKGTNAGEKAGGHRGLAATQILPGATGHPSEWVSRRLNSLCVRSKEWGAIAPAERPWDAAVLSKRLRVPRGARVGRRRRRRRRHACGGAARRIAASARASAAATSAESGAAAPTTSRYVASRGYASWGLGGGGGGRAGRRRRAVRVGRASLQPTSSVPQGQRRRLRGRARALPTVIVRACKRSCSGLRDAALCSVPLFWCWRPPPPSPV